MTRVRVSIVVTTLVALFLVSVAEAHQKGWPGKRLSQVFPEAAKFTSRQVTLSPDQLARIEQALGERVESESRTPTVYPAFDKAGNKIGFVMFADQAGENGSIEIGVAVDAKGTVWHVAVLESREDRRLAKPDFLDQFQGKTVKDALKLGADLTPLVGAEKASQAVATGVRKVLLIKQESFGEQTP